MKKINNSIKMLVINFVSLIVLIGLDQLSKIYFTGIKNKSEIVIIDKVLEFRYLENHGAAFGILQGQRYFFLIIAIIVFAILSFVLIKIPAEKKYIKLNILFTFILAGALGNTIDRLIYGYVRDFIYFSLINFPIFNVADIYITVSTILLVICILFIYKEDDLYFFNTKSKNN